MTFLRERSQFGILFRAFVFQTVDLEVLSSGGDMRALLVQFMALLGAFSLAVSAILVQRQVVSSLTNEQIRIATWGAEEFLVATTIVVSGMLTVLSWNTLLPDRREAVMLGLLPVRVRTVFMAKAAAILTVLGVAVLAVNSFTSLCVPLIANAGRNSMFNFLHSFAAYWATMTLAALFTCSVLLAVQAVAALLLPHRVFLRASSVLQMLAFFTLLAAFFLEPRLANPAALAEPATRTTLLRLPAYWFLGLLQELSGLAQPTFDTFARRALTSLLFAVPVALFSYALGWRTTTRRIVSEPDILPARSRPGERVAAFFARAFLRKPFERAIVLFSARTIARSRQHRMMLALYAGIGLAIAMAYLSAGWYGQSSEPGGQPNTSSLIASLDLLLFAIFGLRAIFALPLTLPANWIFRTTAVRAPQIYFRAVHKTLFALALWPLWFASLAVYMVVWSNRPALEHLAVLIVLGTAAAYASLYNFRKLPFACSYLPGKANLKFKLGAYGILFLFITDALVRIELWSIHRAARFLVFFAFLFVFALWMRRRTLELATAPGQQLQFEDVSAPDVLALGLHEDAPPLQEYPEFPDQRRGRSMWARARLLAAGAALCALSGFIYEHVGAARDRSRFPPIGRRVDIGGRNLNISCIGSGSPTVILESGHMIPGYAWTPIQRAVARITRVCWYDRAGYGWSDPGPFPNHSAQIATDLHKLLAAAHVPPPYVLVGHMFGAFTVRLYRSRFPDEVAGLVLIDPPSEDRTIDNPTLPDSRHPEYLRPYLARLARFLGKFGFWRLLADPGPRPAGFTDSEWAEITALQWQTKTVVARLQEAPLKFSADDVAASGRLGNVPLIVISSGLPERRSSSASQRLRLQLQSRVAHLSKRGTQMILPDIYGKIPYESSEHMIPFEAPQAVVEAIEQVVTIVRQEPRPDFELTVSSSNYRKKQFGIP